MINYILTVLHDEIIGTGPINPVMVIAWVALIVGNAIAGYFAANYFTKEK